MAKPSILIVDDEVIIARELEARLTGLNYTVAGIASSGAEAVRLAQAARPDLVLMDIVLKGEMDGVEAAAEIRHRCHIPVIYVTAYTDHETLERAKVTEPFGYIVKPFSARELNANIEMALYRHRVETRLRRLERWLSAATEETGDAVIAADRDGFITLLNPAAEAITDWPREQAIGRQLGDVFRLVDAGGRALAFDEAAEGPMVSLAGEARLLDRAQRPVPVDSTVSYVRDDQPAGMVSVFRDPTGQRHGGLSGLSADVALAAAQAVTLRGMLQLCAESMVRNLGAAFARIWTVDRPGTTLQLEASAGQYTHLDGEHSRVPVGRFKIGRIAQERRPHLTNDVPNDPRISDPEWARRERMIAFAGYPLMVDDRLVGVMAMFSRRPLSERVLETLGSIAWSVAVAIERKQAEESLRTTQARLQYVLSVSPAVIYSLKLDGERVTSIWVSENVSELLGWKRSETERRDWWIDNLHPDDRPLGETIVAELLAQGTLVSEYRFRRSDGSYRWIRDEKRLIRDPDGRPAECVGSWSDITDRKRAEEALQESERRLRQITENSSAVLWLNNADDSECLYVSPAYEAIWHRSRQSLYDDPTSWLEAIHPDDLPQVKAELRRVLDGEPLTLRFRLVFADGQIRNVEDHCYPIKGRRGHVVRLAGYADDVTERHLLEQQLRQAQKMEAVGQLAGGVAHDFNNLLTVISGYTDILMTDGGLDDSKKAMVEQIAKAGEHAASLTRQLLAFSRKQVLDPRVLDLNALIANQEKMLRRVIGEDVSLTATLRPGLRPVKADRGQLEQVTLNLAVNARDAMPRGGHLTIETADVEIDEGYARTKAGVRPGSHVMLAVSDTGCGMSPEVQAHIFEPFFTTKERGVGTGLGLATVYGIVKQSGGHVAVYSEPGVGTTFKIYLPASDEPHRPREEEARDGRMPRGDETVLLVEDEPAVRAVARHILASCGYRVLEAALGSEALRICEKHQGPVHLVVTDVVMPEMSGRVLAEHLTARRPETKVLYMSGYTDDAVIRHGILKAETAFLQKPFTPQALAGKVREVLDRPDVGRPTDATRS